MAHYINAPTTRPASRGAFLVLSSYPMSDDGPQNETPKPVTHKIHVAAIAEARPGLGMKHRIPGVSKWVAKYFSGYDFFRRERKWVHKEQIINRRDDHYREVVTDPETGEVIHHCDEPLSEHLGHGSDKSKK